MSQAIRRAIYGKLAGDSTLTNMLHAAPTGLSQSIFHEQAPDAAQMPFVVFNQQSGIRDYSLGARNFDDEVWQIKGIARVGDSSTASADDVAGAIADRLDALLTDSTLSISGATPKIIRYWSAVRYSEQPEGQARIIHAGALFRLIYT